MHIKCIMEMSRLVCPREIVVEAAGVGAVHGNPLFQEEALACGDSRKEDSELGS